MSLSAIQPGNSAIVPQDPAILPPDIFSYILVTSDSMSAAAQVSKKWNTAAKVAVFQHLAFSFRQGSLSHFMPRGEFSHRDIVQQTFDTACRHLQQTYPKLRFVPQLQLTSRIFMGKPRVSDIEPYEEAAALLAAYQDLKMGQTEATYLVIGLPSLTDLLHIELPTGFWRKADVIRSRLEELSESPTTSLTTNDVLLKVAACRGLSNIVKSLLRKPNISDRAKEEALSLSVQNGHRDTVELLAPLNISNGAKDWAAKDAAQYGYLNIVELLARCSISNRGKDLMLENAARGGHLDIVKFCTETRNPSDVVKNKMLIGAAEGGHVDVVRFLLEKYTFSDVTEAVVPAAGSDHALELVQLLLSGGRSISDLTWGRALINAAGIGINVVTFFLKKGEVTSGAVWDKALIRAASSGHLDIVQFFAEQYNPSDVVKNKMLTGAAEGGHVDVVRFLLEKYTFSDVTEAVVHAAGNDHALELVQMLLGGRRSISDVAWGRAAAYAAGRRSQALELVRLLLMDGRRYIPNPDRERAVAAAVQSNNLDVVQFLLEGHSISDEAMDTLMTDAAANGHLAIVQFLVGKHRPSREARKEMIDLATRYGYMDIVHFLKP